MSSIKNTTEILPASIYSDLPETAPGLRMDVLSHTDIGERVICAACAVNGFAAKRLTQESYGVMVGKRATWMIDNRIVSDWFAEILEDAYQEQIKDRAVVILPS